MFTRDWVSSKTDTWSRLLNHLKGQPDLLITEIGVYEGRATIWFLENILTHETSLITSIDPRPQSVFEANIRHFRHKVRLIKQPSQIALRDTFFLQTSSDIIYIDGDHSAASVLEDAVLSFRNLKKNGILIFDDYLWKSRDASKKRSELHRPRIAIDAFLEIYADKCVILHKGYQAIIQKL